MSGLRLRARALVGGLNYAEDDDTAAYLTPRGLNSIIVFLLSSSSSYLLLSPPPLFLLLELVLDDHLQRLRELPCVSQPPAHLHIQKHSNAHHVRAPQSRQVAALVGADLVMRLG